MTTPTHAGVVVSMSNIVKVFGPVVANDGAALTLRAGEIHALVGENGAGKSTLMRLLAGMDAPDSGTIVVNGRDVTGWSARRAIAAGVGMVHQHFMLVPTLTVAENMVLGAEPVTHGIELDRKRAEREVAELAQRTGLAVSPAKLVSDLTVGEAQRVEILKTLHRGASVLILDEPTAVLSPPEVADLWHVLRSLKTQGRTIVVITHKLDEVMAISDAITVMRRGSAVASLETSSTTPAEIARAMVGRDVLLPSNAPPSNRSGGTGAAALAVTGLTVRDARAGVESVSGVTFDVAAGEIFGIAGVEGNGQTELIEAIAGLHAITNGAIKLGSRDISRFTVLERGDAGLSHIPEDRHHRGLILDFSIAENLILGRQNAFAKRGTLDRSAVDANARTQISEFDIRPPTPSAAVRGLSGGNQQKVVIARELSRTFSVLLAAHPTRGVDIGAIETIHDRLRKARDRGQAVLLVSADLGELMALSDRIAVMYRGRFATVMARSAATTEILGRYMTGAGAEVAA